MLRAHLPHSAPPRGLALANTIGAGRPLEGSSRRENRQARGPLSNHVVVLGERHLRHLLSSYMTFYNEARTRLSLYKDAPIPREVQGVGRIFATPHLGGLHHQYVGI
jgi:hypothetical protein